MKTLTKKARIILAVMVLGLTLSSLAIWYWPNSYSNFNHVNPATYQPLVDACSAYAQSEEGRSGGHRGEAFENAALKLNLFIDNPAISKALAGQYLGPPDEANDTDWTYFYSQGEAKRFVLFKWTKGGTLRDMYWGEANHP